MLCGERAPPVAKVMRKEARHTQRRDQASGVSLEIRVTQGSNPGLLRCRRILYRLSQQGHSTGTYLISSVFFPVIAMNSHQRKDGKKENINTSKSKRILMDML